MARKRKQKRLPSLFPFLSVLLCAMGVLIVVISAQNLLVVGGELDQVLEVGGGEYADRSPIYVECHEDGITIYPEQVRVALEELQSDYYQINSRIVNTETLAVFEHPESNPWTELLDRLTENYEDEYLVLLIRPEGISSFEASFLWVDILNGVRRNNRAGESEFEEIRVGKDALLSGGELLLTEEGKPLLPDPDAER